MTGLEWLLVFALVCAAVLAVLVVLELATEPPLAPERFTPLAELYQPRRLEPVLRLEGPMIRIITTRRLRTLIDANARLNRAHADAIRDAAAAHRGTELGMHEVGDLLAENAAMAARLRELGVTV